MDVLIGVGSDKLPPQVRDLEDPQQPLPAGAQFFEEKFASGGLVRQFMLGLLLVVIGPPLILFSLALISHTSRWTYYYSDSWQYMYYIGGAGVASVIAGVALIWSIVPKYRLMKRQGEGTQTRYGVFLLDDLLIRHGWFDTTVIPRPFFQGLDGRAVKYVLLGEAKTFDLPREIVRDGQDALANAIRCWASNL
jgi:hypothetical protein